MRTSLTRLASAALGVAVAFAIAARAEDTNKGNRAEGTSSHGEWTVRGMVAGVTTAGETVVNYESGRAEAAEAAFLTIIGSPDRGRRDRDRDADGGRDRANKAEGKSNEGRAMRNRDNVYVLAVTPSTKVREATGGSREAIESAAAASFDKLELGDHVLATFKRADSGQPPKAGDMKHGRHRIYRGELVSLTILPAPARRGGPAADREREGSNTRKPAETSPERK
jgi:hypothetical protein